jgi:hypothetical protein
MTPPARFCARCAKARWVCEAHPNRPWSNGPRACSCGAPGEPCPVCNRTNPDTVPALPEGFVVDVKNDEWNQIGYRLSLLACVASRMRVHFLCDRRRRKPL